MPTHNTAGRSRRAVNEWPAPTEVGACYTVCYAEPIGNTADPRGRAQHYTGFALEHRLIPRLAEHRDGRCGIPIVMAFCAAGIPFTVVAVEHGVTRARENQLKLCGARRRCLLHRGLPLSDELEELNAKLGLDWTKAMELELGQGLVTT